MAYRRRFKRRYRTRGKPLPDPNDRSPWPVPRRPMRPGDPGWIKKPAPIIGKPSKGKYPARPKPPSNPPALPPPAKKSPKFSNYAVHSGSQGAGRIRMYKPKRFNAKRWAKKIYAASNAQVHHQSLTSSVNSVLSPLITSIASNQCLVMNQFMYDVNFWNTNAGGQYPSTAFKTTEGSAAFIRGGVSHLNILNTGTKSVRARVFVIYMKPNGLFPGNLTYGATPVRDWKPTDDRNYFKEYSVSPVAYDKILDPGESWQLNHKIRPGKFLIDGNAPGTATLAGNQTVPLWCHCYNWLGSSNTGAEILFQSGHDMSFTADMIA